jgi:hypothetical protein
MALQVGDSCYATQLDAAIATCAIFQPVYYQDATYAYSLSCVGTDGISRLSLVRTKTTISTNTSVTTNFTQALAYPPCQQDAQLAAYETIFGGVLALFAICYGGYKVISFLGYSRGSHD